jgi:uncharacterized damage-inducible protein DinB
MLKYYTQFNLWANTEMIAWLRKYPEELMEKDVASSFPGIKLTYLHLWGAEDVWLKRLQNLPVNSILSADYQGSTKDVFEGALRISAQFNDFVQQMSPADFEEICDFKLLNGTADSRAKAFMIQHCMNHSTYHRGQVVTLGRQLGMTEPPSTDFMRYVRLK